MISEFNTYLDMIDFELWSHLCHEYGTLRTYNKGEIIISIGKVANFLGLIKLGSVKYVVYNSKMEEKIFGLETIGGFVASWPYCLHNMPSPVSVVANSDMEIYCLPMSVIKELAKDNIDFERQIAHSTEQVFFTIYERLINSYNRTPKERYDALLRKCPTLFNIFSLKDIASYLNITPTHLSRLRKY